MSEILLPPENMLSFANMTVKELKAGNEAKLTYFYMERNRDMYFAPKRQDHESVEEFVARYWVILGKSGYTAQRVIIETAQVRLQEMLRAAPQPVIDELIREEMSRTASYRVVTSDSCLPAVWEGWEIIKAPPELDEFVRLRKLCWNFLTRGNGKFDEHITIPELITLDDIADRLTENSVPVVEPQTGQYL